MLTQILALWFNPLGAAPRNGHKPGYILVNLLRVELRPQASRLTANARYNNRLGPAGGVLAAGLGMYAREVTELCD